MTESATEGGPTPEQIRAAGELATRSMRENKLKADALMTTEAKLPEPDAWIVYTPSGNVVLWSRSQHEANRCAVSYGGTLTPVYAAEKLQAAIAAEREACARVCEDLESAEEEGWAGGASFLARAIRSRGNAP